MSRTPGLPTGYWFPNCFLVPHSVSPIGTRLPKLALTFEAEAIFDPTAGGWRTYSADPGFFATLPAPCVVP